MASIVPRKRKDGSTAYQIKWRENGEQRSETVDNEADAWTIKKALDDNGGSFEAANRFLHSQGLTGITVKELLVEHIAQLTDVSSYQISRYSGAVEHHFGGNLGRLRVKAVSHDDIVQWIRYMQEKGMSPKTISNQHGLLSAAFNTAIRRRYIDFNPSKGVKLPKGHKHGDDDMPTREDFEAIYQQIDPYYQPFFMFLVSTGLRFSEATALLGTDFGLDGPTAIVKVNKAWKQDGSGGYKIGPPKTVKGRRHVSLAPSTVATVRPLVDRAGSDYVFRLKRGGMMRSPAVHTRIWQPAVRAAREAGTLQKHVTIHALRHLHAAMMVQGGMNMYDLSRRLGHNSIQMSLDLYSHLLPDAHFTSAEVAAKALEGL